MNNNQDDQQGMKDLSSKTPGNSATVTEQERELARQAQDEFNRGDYGSCAGSCQKLELLRPQDLKVTHNKIIVDYYRSNDPKRTEILRKSLNAICSSGMNNSTPSQAGNHQQQQPTANSTANNAVTPATPSDSDDVEKSIIRYNQAVVLYHLGQYQAALKIMSNLFMLVELMDETLVHKICLLLIELHLALNRPDDALCFVNYIESQFTSNFVEKSSLDGNSIVKGNLKPPPVIMPGDKEPKKDSIDMAADAFKIKLLKYKLRIYLKTLQVGMCIKEWNTLVSLGMPRNLSTIFLEANLEYLKKNYKHSMTLLNNIRNDKCPDFKSCGESIAVLYYNNIASIHFAMGKPNLACYYLRTALNENKKAIESISKDEGTNNIGAKSQALAPHHSALPSLHTLGWNKHYELTYSLGVSLLYSGQPIKAFDCFTETAQHFHNNPRLWLRMAECCILCHKESNRIDFDISGRRKDIVQKVIDENNGTGVARKFILTHSLSQNSKYNPQGLSYAIPQPTLEFGMLCLKNACFILKTTKKEEPCIPAVKHPVSEIEDDKKLSLDGSLSFSSPNHKLGNNNSTTQRQPAFVQSETSQATIVENLNLMISILAASAYVSLCLGDYKPALGYAKSLLNIQKLPGAYWLLGNLYAAESLIYLDRIREALDYLKPESLQDVQTYIRIEDKDMKGEEVILQKPSKVSWYPTNIATAKVIFKYNLAVAYAIRGELDKSGEILKQVWTSKGPECDVPIHVIMLALYIELQLGHVEIARTLIKQHCPMPHQ